MTGTSTITTAIILVVVGSYGVSAVSPSDYKCAEIFEQMSALMKANGEALVKVIIGKRDGNSFDAVDCIANAYDSNYVQASDMK